MNRCAQYCRLRGLRDCVRWSLIAALFALGASSCLTAQKVRAVTPGNTASRHDAEPLLVVSTVRASTPGKTASRHARAATSVVYKLSPFDLLRVTIYGEEDLESEQRISDKGMLSVPLVGEVPVGGLTVSEASKKIERSFVENQYLRNPIVTISIKEFAPKVVTVLGEVESPGSIEIPPGRNGIPVQIAIAGAGGFTGTAKTTEVNVTRAAAYTGEKVSVVVNVDKILKSSGKNVPQDGFLVRPDDVVFVPRRVF